MAGAQLHEDLTREDEVVGSSDRAFGLTFAVIFGIVGLIQLWYGLRPAWAWLAGATARLKDILDQHFRRGEYAA